MMTKEQAAQNLANFHFSLEDGMRGIYRIRRNHADAESAPNEPIKLLEVNEFTIATGVMPLGFSARPQLGIDYPAIIVAVTPEEFERIQSSQLELPDGWTVGEELPRPMESNGDE